MSNGVTNNIDWSILDSFLESAERAEGVMMYTSPYALYVEVPTSYDDKKPPFEPIFEWTKRNFVREDPEELRQLAFKIQNHIYENGTEGVFYMTKTKKEFETTTAQQIIDNYNGNLEEAPENIIERMLSRFESDSLHKLTQAGKIDTKTLVDSSTYKMYVSVEEVESQELDINV